MIFDYIDMNDIIFDISLLVIILFINIFYWTINILIQYFAWKIMHKNTLVDILFVDQLDNMRLGNNFKKIRDEK